MTANNEQLKIIPAKTVQDIDKIKKLFIEYQQFLGFDLCFQNFQDELDGLPGNYCPPDGRLFLSLINDKPVGCVALKKLEKDVCEMKRLYTKSKFRGKGFGRQLAIKIIEEAKLAGYKTMRLDTVSFLKEALSLYYSLGFKQTEAYCFNPRDDVIYMELDLTNLITL